MQIPNWTPYEFLNAAVLTSGFGAVSGSFAQSLSGIMFPGLIAPNSLSVGVTGLAVSVTAPLPFQVLFSGGVLAGASGIVTGQVTNVYAANFSGFVPGSGTTTAYLLVSGYSIQGGAYQVVGPPPGHPDYNPLFSPSTAYNTAIDSLTIYTSATAADNLTSFEIARTTLAAAATGVSLVYTNQIRASASIALTQVQAVSGVLSLIGLPIRNRTFNFTSSGSLSLPSASGYNGVDICISNATSGAIGVFAASGDVFYGVTNLSTPTSLTITAYGSVNMRAELGSWFVTAVSQSLAAAPVFGLTYAGAFTSGFTIQGGFMYDLDTTAGSFSGTYSGVPAVADTFGLNRAGVNLFTINWGANGKYLGDALATAWYTENLKFFRWSGANRGFVSS